MHCCMGTSSCPSSKSFLFTYVVPEKMLTHFGTSIIAGIARTRLKANVGLVLRLHLLVSD